jgi:hypothetical protein
MQHERICGALGCRNDADGVTPDGTHTCLECADANEMTVQLYDTSCDTDPEFEVLQDE